MKRFTSVEARIDAAAHSVLDRLPAHGLYGALVEFLVFGLKQAWACLFGGAMLALIIATRLFWPDDAGIERYDFLFLAALAIQLAMLGLKLETLAEAKVILIFHVVGTAMELFKTSAGSWIYPEDSLFRIGGVPLFSGFMYAAVGSYLARISRIFDMRYAGYPPLWATAVLAGAIYVNFFAHHYVVDMRYGLFAATALLYFRTVVHYRVFRFRHRMPLLIGFLLVALFIWFAENIGTWSRAWIYPGQQDAWTPVSIQKLGSWYLLMIISFVLVTFVHRPRQVEAEQAKPRRWISGLAAAALDVRAVDGALQGVFGLAVVEAAAGSRNPQTAIAAHAFLQPLFQPLNTFFQRVLVAGRLVDRRLPRLRRAALRGHAVGRFRRAGHRRFSLSGRD